MKKWQIRSVGDGLRQTVLGTIDARWQPEALLKAIDKFRIRKQADQLKLRAVLIGDKDQLIPL